MTVRRRSKIRLYKGRFEGLGDGFGRRASRPGFPDALIFRTDHFLKLILDTNIVLDWLVFNDPALQSLNDAVRKGDVVLYSHRTTLDELRRVLTYPALQLNEHRQSSLSAQYRSLTQDAGSPPEFSPQNLCTPAGFPRCRDPDDQLFVALALHNKVDALVSRDRQVLALRKRAAKFAVEIMDVAQLNVALSGLRR